MFHLPTPSSACPLEIDAGCAVLSPNIALSHVGRLFRESGALLTGYSDAQVNDGLGYLLQGSASFRWLHDVRRQSDGHPERSPVIPSWTCNRSDAA